ncbi:MAG: hypothetical protein ACO1OG_11845 [Devosia sp.]
MTLSKFAKIAVACLAMALGGATALPVAAQDMNVTVIVPDAPGGARFTGCYTVNQRLYGPYRMSFCLEQRGTYTVRGGGVTCNGRLDWDVSGRTIEVDLRRTSCGNGVAWSADSMSCTGTSLFGGKGIGAAIGQALAKVIVPNVPTIRGLSCTYYPDARGEKPTKITADRTS